MKKWFLIGLFLILLAALFMPSVSAEEYNVWDYADLFSAEQEAELAGSIAALEERYDIAFGVLTTDYAEGKTAKTYVEDFCVDNGIGLGRNKESCVVLLIDMDNREAYIATSGEAIRYLTDRRIEAVLDDVFVGLGEGDFYDAAVRFLSSTTGYIEAGIEEGQHNYDTETGEIDVYKRPPGPVFYIVTAAVSLAAALIVGLVFTNSVKQKYRFKEVRTYYPYREKCRINLRVNNDILIDSHISKQYIPPPPPPSSGGGGSSMRSSGSSSSGRSSVSSHSSGRSFGGGGRKF